MRVFKDIDLANNKIKELEKIVLKANAIGIPTIPLLDEAGSRILKQELCDFTSADDIEMVKILSSLITSKEKNGNYRIRLRVENNDIDEKIRAMCGKGLYINMGILVKVGDNGEILYTGLDIVVMALGRTTNEVTNMNIRVCGICIPLTNEKNNSLAYLDECIKCMKDNIDSYKGIIEIKVGDATVTFGENKSTESMFMLSGSGKTGHLHHI